jgi:hypothetical protein
MISLGKELCKLLLGNYPVSLCKSMNEDAMMRGRDSADDQHASRDQR